MSTNVSDERVLALKNKQALLTDLLDKMHDEIREERAGEPLNATQVESEMDVAQQKLDVIVTKLKKAKAHIAKRKVEITQWKESFDRLAHDNKTQELAQLQSEIAWRAADIAAKETEVAALYESRIAAEGLVENWKVKEMVVKEGFHLLDIEQDPRLLALKDELLEVTNELTNLQPKN